MFNQGTSALVVKILAGLATFAVTTIMVFWLARIGLSITVSAWLALAAAVIATVAVVKNFDRMTGGRYLGTPPPAPMARPPKSLPRSRQTRH